MNQYVTGIIIKELREKNRFTQLQLADKLGVSDKTVSKWETGKGYPDITLLESIASVFHISISELFSGSLIKNSNVTAKMTRTKIYVCPICGNCIAAIGEASITCHGILLTPSVAEPANEMHSVSIERIEDEYYIQIRHEMSKQHFISFIAGLSSDGIQLIKLYPEGDAEARIKICGVERIIYYCNHDGLFFIDMGNKDS